MSQDIKPGQVRRIRFVDVDENGQEFNNNRYVVIASYQKAGETFGFDPEVYTPIPFAVAEVYLISWDIAFASEGDVMLKDEENPEYYPAFINRLMRCPVPAEALLEVEKNLTEETMQLLSKEVTHDNTQLSEDIDEELAVLAKISSMFFEKLEF